MNYYVITGKIWIKVFADNEEEAKDKAKKLADKAHSNYRYNFVQAGNRVSPKQESISKVKIIWVKEKK